MSFPFTHAPIFREFREKLKEEFGCLYKIENVSCAGDVELNEVSCFVREHDSETLRCVVELEDEEIVELWVVKNICERLKIDTSFFGLKLGVSPSDIISN
jgi:hypothetical protein